MSNQNERSEELFDKLSKNKKKKKRKILRTILIIILIVAFVLVGTVMHLRKRVEDRFASVAADVLTYEVTTGTIHTLVSGSGTLTQVDLESLTVPAGVDITEVIAKRNQNVQAGDLLATVDMSTVLTALSDLQSQLDSLDEEIADAKGDEVSRYISAGIAGRVKQILATEGTDVSACMAEHGALAVLSLDGYMAVDVDSEALAKGDAVTVILSDGSEKDGTVDTAVNGKVTVLIADDGPVYGDTVTVVAEDGTEIGTGSLYIHSPLGITGYAGTISTIHVKENAKVYASTNLFTLKNTSFTANYDTLLRQRSDLEEELMAVLTIYRDGAILSPMDGVVSSIDYTESSDSTLLYSTAATEETETALLTLYPNVSMSVTIGIGESDILTLEVGQEASISVSSVSEDSFPGTVTEISKEADISSGVTQYSAVVTLDKAEGMLPGMTASVDVSIEGVEDALIIPVDALHQTSSVYYVYTSYDAETQQYGGMVQVTTGMQNDDYVEILSGLSEGDTVYYTEQETFSFGFGFSGMGGSGMPSGMVGGSMPSGMPSGGIPSGMGGRGQGG